MPTLPTLTVTQQQADRLLAVFGSAAAYKAWLKDTLVSYVLAVESQQEHEALSAQRKTEEDFFRQDMQSAT